MRSCLICGKATTVWNRVKGRPRVYEQWYTYKDGYACATCYQRGFKPEEQKIKRVKGVLDSRSRGLILTTVSNRNEEAARDCHYTNNPKLPLTDYIEKILALNMVICFKCMEEIKIGDRYKKGSHTIGRRDSKFYHDSCYEKLWY